MKIISSGKSANDKSVIFKCDKCGCRFRAEEDEYYESSSLDNISHLTYYAATHFKYFHANCPECHKMCVELKEEPWHNITTTYCNCQGTTADPPATDHVTITCDAVGDVNVKST